MKKPFRLILILAVFLFIALFFLPKRLKYHTESPVLLISSGVFSGGDSFYTVLQAEGLTPPDIVSITEALSKQHDPHSCLPGDKYELFRTTAGVFVSFYYMPDPETAYVVKNSTDEGITVYKQKLDMEKKVFSAMGSITTSLWEAMSKQGIKPEIIMNYADIFAWQIDFLTEPRPGDIYELAWERYFQNGEFIREGNILVARYKGKEAGEQLAFNFETKIHGREYFDANGKSLRKSFLRAPLNYRRISSYFTHKRFHPILRYWRPHLGIDYSAPRGTPVVAIGDGVVIFRGRKGQNGNLVMIKHNSTYTSTYGHLSKYGRGIKKGSKVRQGQVIGYVGSTGLATGSHLDFRIKKNDKYVNFLKLSFPPIRVISKEENADFMNIKRTGYFYLANNRMLNAQPAVIEDIIE